MLQSMCRFYIDETRDSPIRTIHPFESNCIYLVIREGRFQTRLSLREALWKERDQDKMGP